MGCIATAFGVRGELKVNPFTEEPASVLELTPWRLVSPAEGATERTALPGREVRVIQGRPHGADGVVVQLEGVNDRDQALALRGWEIYVPREILPEADEESFYWNDLIGCRVVDGEGVELGTVSHLFATGANDVLVVRGPGGERWFPFTKEVAPIVDLAQRLLVVHPLPGM
ncbi:MAG: 16S rRNA processing protein RimM [Magnetococcales bacterium]|nr:16S rRNA processing protein RimM [Magnetococcales bacterium]